MTIPPDLPRPDPMPLVMEVLEVPILPWYILSNCWELVRLRHPSLPPTKVILANLQDEPAEVGVFWYPPSRRYPQGTYHYVSVISSSSVGFSYEQTNYNGGKYSLGASLYDNPNFVGFYDIKSAE